MIKIPQFGWNSQRPDFRDYNASFRITKLPKFVDLRPQFTAIYDQGQLGSCVGNAVAAAYEYEDKKQKHPYFMPSRLFIYYNARSYEGTTSYDAGASIRDGIKAVNKLGVCPESEWTYDISLFANRPNPECYTIALKNQVVIYASVLQQQAQLKTCLYSGFPIVFGFSVYSSFMTDKVASTGIVPLPKKGESMEGGHAVVCVGYDDSTQMFICRNSWGIDWGMQGYFLMPYSYLTNRNLSSDFWIIKLTE